MWVKKFWNQAIIIIKEIINKISTIIKINSDLGEIQHTNYKNREKLVTPPYTLDDKLGDGNDLIVNML